jgi:DUF4097 and DUF4098 domain-containing protein YvlB
MFLATIVLLGALGGPWPPACELCPAGGTAGWAQGGTASTRPAQTDETVAVSRGARLTINNFAGEVVIRAWDRDAIRVQARHASRTRVSIRTIPSGIGITASGTHGPAGSVDYEISAPAWMAVKIDGTYVYVAVEGMQGEVTAENVRGDISVKGGSAFVSAKSVEGEIILEGIRGRVNASSVNQGITISGAVGDITAETINGPIKMSKIESENVDVGTVNGNIAYEGSAAPRGRYRFSTHNGNIIVAVPETASAAFTVRTYNGSVNKSLPLQGGGDFRSGRRVTYTLGTGSAEFELESFGGTIHLRRAGAQPASKSKDERPAPDSSDRRN